MTVMNEGNEQQEKEIIPAGGTAQEHLPPMNEPPVEEMAAEAPKTQPKETIRHYRPSSGIVWGLLLIALGVYFFLREFEVIKVGFNWWALFIFIPAFGSLAGAWSAFWRKRRCTAAVRSRVGSGVVIGTVATLLLLDLNWGVWWPAMVIAGGFSIFLNGFVDRGGSKSVADKNWTMWNLWIGMGAMLLGAAFLLDKLAIFSVQDYIPARHWWSVFAAIPGVGALLHAVIVAFSRGKHRATSLGLGIIGMAILAVAAVAYFSLSWSYLAPAALIGAGVVFLADTFVRSIIMKDSLSDE